MKLLDSLSLSKIQIFPRITTHEFYKFILQYANSAVLKQSPLRLFYINEGGRRFNKGLNNNNDD